MSCRRGCSYADDLRGDFGQCVASNLNTSPDVVESSLDIFPVYISRDYDSSVHQRVVRGPAEIRAEHYLDTSDDRGLVEFEQVEEPRGVSRVPAHVEDVRIAIEHGGETIERDRRNEWKDTRHLVPGLLESE